MIELISIKILFSQHHDCLCKIWQLQSWKLSPVTYWLIYYTTRKKHLLTIQQINALHGVIIHLRYTRFMEIEIKNSLWRIIPTRFLKGKVSHGVKWTLELCYNIRKDEINLGGKDLHDFDVLKIIKWYQSKSNCENRERGKNQEKRNHYHNSKEWFDKTFTQLQLMKIVQNLTTDDKILV